MSSYLPEDDLFSLITHGNLTSVDLIVYNPDGHVLVGMRNNRPAQHSWFVPGGIIQKSEHPLEALKRISLREFGVIPTSPSFFALARHLYDDNFRGTPGISTSYLVLAFECHLSNEELSPDDQHERLLWRSPEELLLDPEVHPNTKAYFEQVASDDIIVFRNSM